MPFLYSPNNHYWESTLCQAPWCVKQRSKALWSKKRAGNSVHANCFYKCLLEKQSMKYYTWKWKMNVWVVRSCLTLCDLNYSLPGSSVHGILQIRTLEWVAIPFSRGSSWSRNQIQVSCTAGRYFSYTYYNIDEPWKHDAHKRSQAQKVTHCMLSCIWNFSLGKSIETESCL